MPGQRQGAGLTPGIYVTEPMDAAREVTPEFTRSIKMVLLK